MKLRFKNRIALFNTFAAAISTLLVFIVVYAVVYSTAYRHLDADIREEKDEIFHNVRWKGDSIILHLMPEWQEREHKQAEVNPTFLQIVDQNGRMLFHSANLQNDHLLFEPDLKNEKFFNILFNNKRIRQGQFPIRNDNGKVIGQLNIGISQVESALVLYNLRITLYIAFPLLLLVLYLATSIAAAQGIAPVNKLIKTAGHINDSNISTRLPVPEHQDELHQLAITVNELLHRIENSFRREKQITADVSHELRTPLAAIRGTLEVLIRKHREPQQYEEKIGQVIREVDRMNQLLDQLLQLARLEAGSIAVRRESIRVAPFLHTLLEKWQTRFEEKEVRLFVDVVPDACVTADNTLLERIIENLLDNALKYGAPHGTIRCTWHSDAHTLSLTDDGPGIPPEYIPLLFDRFFRADTSRNSTAPGTGLGLAIVKKLTDLQGIGIQVNSREGAGTTFTLQFFS